MPRNERDSAYEVCHTSALYIRLSVGGWRSHSTNEACDREDRHRVRQHRHELRRNRRADRAEHLTEFRCETEKQRRERRAGGAPATEDECRESDEALADGHVLAEVNRRSDRE